MNKRDKYVGFTFFLIGVAVVYHGLMNLGLGNLKSPGPGFFPVICGVCIAVFSGIWIFSLRNGENLTDLPFWEKGDWIRPLMAVGITMGYAATMDDLGFILSTFLFIVAWQYGIEREKWGKNMIISLVGTAGMFAIFQILLSVPLPGGLFSL